MSLLKILRQSLYRAFAPTSYVGEVYRSFRALLESDHQSHERMARLERLYHDKKAVDFHSVVKTYDELSRSIFEMIAHLDDMAPRSYGRLLRVLRDIDSAIRETGLRVEGVDPSAPLVLPLDQVPPHAEGLVGGKAFRLSNVATELHLPTPKGFIITTRAFHLICEANRLRPAIDAALAHLEVDSFASLEETSARLKELIQGASLPVDLLKAIADFFASSPSAPVRLAMRSSAAGEDGPLSFAGQFKTLLNVSPEKLGEAYKEVLASKYSSKALHYRVKNGFLDEETPMAALVLEMVDPLSSGIVYSRSPVTSGSDTTTVYSVWGLGEPLVKGVAPPDVIEIAGKGESLQVVRRAPFTRETKAVLSPEGGIETLPLENHERGLPSLVDREAVQLARWALQLEDFFGSPQDLEWCLDREGRLCILQTRPLRVETPSEVTCEMDGRVIPNPVLFSGGERAASGIASGKVVLAFSPEDLKGIPEKTVLVARTTSPRWAQVMDRLSAVVTDLGSVAGHFASVAREWRIPTLVNTKVATRTLRQGQTVTVDADHNRVFSGEVDGLPPSSCERRRSAEESPFRRRLREILDHTSPLNLLDPQDSGFSPEGCRTLHDLVRFAHEKAVQEMFSLGGRGMRKARGVRRLISEIPIALYILDLGRGIRDAAGSRKKVDLTDVDNMGLRALWKGLSHPEILWSSDVLHFDWQEFDRLSAGAVGLDSQLLGSFAVISRDYLNVNIRFGYHFVVIDALLDSDPRGNYISLRFKGGGAPAEQTRLRVRFLAEVLRKHRFETDPEGDTIDARLRGEPLAGMEKKMEMLGFLLGYTRLLDMKLSDMQAVETCTREFLSKYPPE